MTVRVRRIIQSRFWLPLLLAVLVGPPAPAAPRCPPGLDRVVQSLPAAPASFLRTVTEFGGSGDQRVPESGYPNIGILDLGWIGGSGHGARWQSQGDYYEARLSRYADTNSVARRVLGRLVPRVGNVWVYLDIPVGALRDSLPLVVAEAERAGAETVIVPRSAGSPAARSVSTRVRVRFRDAEGAGWLIGRLRRLRENPETRLRSAGSGPPRDIPERLRIYAADRVPAYVWTPGRSAEGAIEAGARRGYAFTHDLEQHLPPPSARRRRDVWNALSLAQRYSVAELGIHLRRYPFSRTVNFLGDLNLKTLTGEFGVEAGVAAGAMQNYERWIAYLQELYAECLRESARSGEVRAIQGNVLEFVLKRRFRRYGWDSIPALDTKGRGGFYGFLNRTSRPFTDPEFMFTEHGGLFHLLQAEYIGEVLDEYWREQARRFGVDPGPYATQRFERFWRDMGGRGGFTLNVFLNLFDRFFGRSPQQPEGYYPILWPYLHD